MTSLGTGDVKRCCCWPLQSPLPGPPQVPALCESCSNPLFHGLTETMQQPQAAWGSGAPFPWCGVSTQWGQTCRVPEMPHWDWVPRRTVCQEPDFGLSLLAFCPSTLEESTSAACPSLLLLWAARGELPATSLLRVMSPPVQPCCPCTSGLRHSVVRELPSADKVTGFSYSTAATESPLPAQTLLPVVGSLWGRFYPDSYLPAVFPLHFPLLP